MKNEIIWYGLRISFYSLISFWLLDIFTNWSGNVENPIILFFIIIWIISLVITFIYSILHLIKFKEKGFAILALIVSSFGLLFFLTGVIIGIITITFK